MTESFLQLPHVTQYFQNISHKPHFSNTLLNLKDKFLMVNIYIQKSNGPSRKI